MQNLKSILIILFLFFNFYSCKPKISDNKNDKKNIMKEQVIETKVFNDVFLQILDTPYFPYDNFLTHDLDTRELKKGTNLIAVSNKLKPLLRFLDQIGNEIYDLPKSDKKEYLEVFHNYQNDTTIHKLLIDSLKNIGRFQLTENYDFTQNANNGVLGSIQFSRIAFNSKITKAFFVVTIKDKVKSGIENLVFLELVNNRWNIFKSIILSEM